MKILFKHGEVVYAYDQLATIVCDATCKCDDILENARNAFIRLFEPFYNVNDTGLRDVPVISLRKHNE